MPASGLRDIGRNTQGVRLIDLAEDDRVVSIATLLPLDESNGQEEASSETAENTDPEGAEPTGDDGE